MIPLTIMPSSPGYIRDYKREAAIETPERQRQRQMRVKARRAFAMTLGHPIPQGMDVDHRRPLSKGGSNKKTNLGLQKASSNRSYPRTKSGSMRSKFD